MGRTAILGNWQHFFGFDFIIKMPFSICLKIEILQHLKNNKHWRIKIKHNSIMYTDTSRGTFIYIHLTTYRT